MNTEQAQLHMRYIYIQPVAMVTYVYASNVGDKWCLSIQFDEAISTTPEWVIQAFARAHVCTRSQAADCRRFFDATLCDTLLIESAKLSYSQRPDRLPAAACPSVLMINVVIISTAASDNASC